MISFLDFQITQIAACQVNLQPFRNFWFLTFPLQHSKWTKKLRGNHINFKSIQYVRPQPKNHWQCKNRCEDVFKLLPQNTQFKFAFKETQFLLARLSFVGIRSWSNFQEKATTLDDTGLFLIDSNTLFFDRLKWPSNNMILRATYMPTWPWKTCFDCSPRPPILKIRTPLLQDYLLQIIKQIKFPHEKWFAPQKRPTSNPFNPPHPTNHRHSHPFGLRLKKDVGKKCLEVHSSPKRPFQRFVFLPFPTFLSILQLLVVY